MSSTDLQLILNIIQIIIGAIDTWLTHRKP